MGVIDGRTWFEHLSATTCWKLLGETPVGRIGVLVDSAPEIYPVNYVVDRDTIVFRTGPGEKLRGLDRSPSVCFQIDAIDPATKSGWSVLVKGRAKEVTHPDELHHLGELTLDYWTIATRPNWIRITPAEVTGRRIHHGSGAEN
jgi:nitroimidazol reductase NimA-like FMN-containing flavoprotein (pyridoxamine 5'-phosphate oxidase superfamily)